MIFQRLLFFVWLALVLGSSPACTPPSLNENPSLEKTSERTFSPDSSDASEVVPEQQPEPPVCRKAEVLDHNHWSSVPLLSDPFRSLVPGVRECSKVGWKEEDGLLEIDTEICNFVTLQQRLKADIPKGAPLKIVFWHLTLVANEPAQSRALLKIGNVVVWDWKAEIPKKAELYEQTFRSPKTFLKGTPLLFHLHNHGNNNYRLLSLERGC